MIERSFNVRTAIMSPRTKEQIEEIRSRTKHAIMVSALELFCNGGYHGTTVNMIAKKAGVSTGLMYNYFRGKDELLEEIIREGMEIIESPFMKASTTYDSKLRIAAMIDGIFEIMIDEDPHFWRLYLRMLMQPGLPESATKLFSTFLSRIFDELESTFQDLGSPDPAVEARIFSALSDGLMLHYWLAKKEFRLDALKDIILRRYVGIKHVE
jgi:AcrR family transcriptional regulator